MERGKKMGSKMIIVDGNAIARRFYHAANAESMKDVSTNFLDHLADLKVKEESNYMYCIFDNKGDTFRNKIEITYKEGRKPEPEFVNDKPKYSIFISFIRSELIKMMYVFSPSDKDKCIYNKYYQNQLFLSFFRI
jgi:5'-3' exonuclease